MADPPDPRARGAHFRDAGLHSTPLRALNALGAVPRAFGLELPSLEPEALAHAARRRAGLDDFGGPGWRDALEVLCLALEHEARLTTFGRIALREMIVGALATRLRLIRWAAEHPEVRDEPIEQPWVVVGLPRTGTTLLSHLLALDPNVRPLLQWEASDPLPPPDLATHAEDPRIAACARHFERLARLNPPVRAMHPMGATLATECVTLLALDLRSLAFETQAFVPSYGRWLENADMRGAYAMHRLALQVLQSRIPTPAWSLKTPNHLWCLDVLAEFYPDARIVWTHRDPRKVVASVASLNTALQSLGARRPDPVAIGAHWDHCLHTGVARGLDFDRRQAGRDWCAHLQYADLVADPLGAVRKLYAHFGGEVGALHARRMQAWMRARPQDAEGRHVYDPADFGLRADAIAERYAEYSERFGVPPEAAGEGR